MATVSGIGWAARSTSRATRVVSDRRNSRARNSGSGCGTRFLPCRHRQLGNRRTDSRQAVRDDGGTAFGVFQPGSGLEGQIVLNVLVRERVVRRVWLDSGSGSGLFLGLLTVETDSAIAGFVGALIIGLITPL